MTGESTAGEGAFSDRMVEILNCSALNLALAIGYRTGLLDAMDLADRPQSADRLADKSGLDLRYILEWLGVMVTGKIVELSAAPDGENLYFLPRHHADFLTRRAGNANLGVYTQEMPLLTVSAMEAVIRGFNTGDGVSYDNYPKFQEFMSQLADAKHGQVLVDRFFARR